MSDIQPENYPNSSEQIDDFVSDPADMLQVIEGRATRMKQFFDTEFSAFSVLQRVAAAQEKMGAVPQETNEQGYWEQYPLIDYNPDYADSSKRRFLNIAFHTSNLGMYPRLAVRANLGEEPVEYYERVELLVARAALKGEFLKATNGDGQSLAHLTHTLMGPPSKGSETLVRGQQRYVRWVYAAAQITGVSLVGRSRLFVPPSFSNAN